MTERLGHNGGPPIEDSLTLYEAQNLRNYQLRPSHVERHPGPGSPLRAIVGTGGLGAVGRRVLLSCGHWREIRDYDIMPAMNRSRPKDARCGCCRLGYLPDPAFKAHADARAKETA